MTQLDNPIRRQILRLLRDRELSAGAIAHALGRPRPGVSHHLARLNDDGILVRRTIGSFRYYSLTASLALSAWDEYVVGDAWEAA